jgi:integrase
MLRDDITAWLHDVAQQHKPSTARFYGSRSAWIRTAFGDRDWPDLTPIMVLRALDQANRWSDQRHKAPDTQRANAIAWEQLQRWAIETGRCEKPVLTEALKKPAGRQRERLPTSDEVQRILAKASPAFVSIYRALLLTGARPGELCAAQVADYHPADGVILLQDHKTAKKTKRPRAIPIGDTLRPLLRTAIGDRTEGPIFRTAHGMSWTTERLSNNFRRIRDQLQLDRDLVLYSARHKFATELCHSQGIEAAAAVLGHQVLQTTRRYVHHDTSQLVKYANAVDATDLGVTLDLDSRRTESKPPADRRTADSDDSQTSGATSS